MYCFCAASNLLTNSAAGKSGVGNPGKSRVSPSFLPEKMRKDEPTPDYARKDEPTPDYAGLRPPVVRTSVPETRTEDQPPVCPGLAFAVTRLFQMPSLAIEQKRGRTLSGALDAFLYSSWMFNLSWLFFRKLKWS